MTLDDEITEAVFKTIRPEIRRFAYNMEMMLVAHDHERGDSWKECDEAFLRGRMWWEVHEFVDALDHKLPPSSIIHEAADVANFLMFIVENYKRDRFKQ